ncbi:MAG: glycosyltransferase involved in cell wall biosynthesis [Bradymonadia bacterium]|jgi:glycosyltransferase involved in cell wall biosynthesis
MTRKITFCANSLSGGGAETQLVRLAIGLKQRGWVPNILTLLEGNDFVEPLEQAEIPVTLLGMQRGIPDPRGIARMIRELRRHRPDVLSTFLVAANTIGRIAGRAARVPIIVSSIRTPILANPKREWQLRLTRRLGDLIVFNSQTIADDAVARGLVLSEQVRVIRNGLDMSLYDENHTARAEVRAELGLADDDFMWLVVGHLRAEKNYPTLVKAFRSLRRAHPNVRLVSAGGFFDVHEEILAMVPDELADGTVQLLGLRRDVPRLMAAADAFVLPSLYEASPNGLIEALASRLPAVATNVGGVPEIIPSPAEGILARTSGHDDLLGAMSAMMGLTNTERRALGDAGRIHVERTYGKHRMVDEWESLYMSLLANV